MANITRKQDELAPTMGWDPFEMMREMLGWDPFRQMSRLRAREGQLGFAPQFEVKETRDGYLFRADLPGVDEKNLDITLTGNRLTVSGHREEEKRDENDTYFTYERSYGNFSRSFTLPEGVDGDRIQADLKNGVLTLLLPKLPEHQPKKISLRGMADKVKGVFDKDKDREKQPKA